MSEIYTEYFRRIKQSTPTQHYSYHLQTLPGGMHSKQVPGSSYKCCIDFFFAGIDTVLLYKYIASSWQFVYFYDEIDDFNIFLNQNALKVCFNQYKFSSS